MGGKLGPPLQLCFHYQHVNTAHLYDIYIISDLTDLHMAEWTEWSQLQLPSHACPSLPSAYVKATLKSVLLGHGYLKPEIMSPYAKLFLNVDSYIKVWGECKVAGSSSSVVGSVSLSSQLTCYSDCVKNCNCFSVSSVKSFCILNLKCKKTPKNKPTLVILKNLILCTMCVANIYSVLQDPLDSHADKII